MSSQLKDFLDWPYQEQVFKLERRVISTKTGKVQERVVYGITSLTRDVTLHGGQTRLTGMNAARVLACLNNLVLGSLIGKLKYRYLAPARRFFAAHPDQALALLTRLYASPDMT